MKIEVRPLERLCHDRDALNAAYRAGRVLQDNRWMHFPPACWDEPALVAYAGDTCVAGINWSIDEKQRTAAIDFAWCSSDWPSALLACLLHLRRKLAEAPLISLSFTHHVGNEAMEKLVDKLGLEPVSRRFEVPMARFARPLPASTAPSRLQRLRTWLAGVVAA